MKPKKSHPLCRPPKKALDVRALSADGRWRNDDGKPARAFFGLLEPDMGDPITNAIVWVAECSCATYRECPMSKALDKASDLYGGASVFRQKAIKT